MLLSFSVSKFCAVLEAEVTRVHSHSPQACPPGLSEPQQAHLNKLFVNGLFSVRVLMEGAHVI